MGLAMSSFPSAGVQGMFNLAPGPNHFTEVEVMAMCLYTGHLEEVCVGLLIRMCFPRELMRM